MPGAANGTPILVPVTVPDAVRVQGGDRGRLGGHRRPIARGPPAVRIVSPLPTPASTRSGQLAAAPPDDGQRSEP